MKLYHGSLVQVEKPQILPRIKNKTYDFGLGFYTTTNFEQAKKWVFIKQRQTESTEIKGYVSVFDCPDDILKNKTLDCKLFKKADKSWLDFVIKNRTNLVYEHGYDIVAGPVANDRVYTTINLYESGLFDLQSTLRELKTYRLVDQFLFHTQKALEFLTFISTETVL